MSSVIATSATQDVFELVLARPVLTEGGDHPHLVHLWWRAPQQGERVVQVYVDGELVDVALEPAQRELWLSVDRGIARHIELVALDSDVDDVWKPVPLSAQVTSAAAVTLMRDETLAVDTHVAVREGGAVLDAAAMWPGDEHRSGFGALFGEGAFGFDASTGPGLGLGELGYGPLGSDNFAWRWRRDDLASGEHTLELHATSGDGEALAGALAIDPLTIERLPAPPVNLRMTSDFTLTWDQP